MPWQEITLLDHVARDLAAVSEPTNPSSLVLAGVGIAAYLCYQILARPGHEGRRPTVIAKPQAVATVVEAAPDERRVA
jgi:hypothetical protein